MKYYFIRDITLVTLEEHTCKISRCRCNVCIMAAPLVGSSDIFSLIFDNFSNICSISIERESNTCSPKSGDVSALVLADVVPPELTLLYATNFKSISFSKSLACFLKSKDIEI